ATESGTSLYEKSETDEFFDELEKFICPSNDYGDSDTDGTDERRGKTSNNVRTAYGEAHELGENEYREKSPGFGDFFRIDESNIQLNNGNRRPDLLSDNRHSVDDDNFTTETNTRHSTPEKMDELYTGDSDDDVGNGNDNIRPSNTTVYKAVDEFKIESKNVIQRAADQLARHNWGGNVCYVSDVVVPPGRSGVVRFVDDICRYIQFYRKQPFVIVSEHDDHVHIAHACVQANQACRCAWLQRCSDYRKYRRKHLRGRVYACNLGGSDWASVMRYFCTNGRVAKEVYLPGANEGIRNQIRNLSKEQDPVHSKEGLVEACIDEGSWDIFGRKSALRSGNEGSRGHIGRRVQTAESQNGNHDNGSLPVTIDELLKYYPTCPPDAFINIKEFYLNPALNRYDETDRNVRLQLRNWCNVIRDWDLYDFNTYYHTTGVKPYFNAYSRTSVSVYYSVEKSINIANELLRYQFENDEIVIKQFLNTLYNVLDKKIPKLNSICIYSPPSAGKNFFFDAVASYFLNYGMFGTANKNNNFTWADGAGKRLVIWNEPNYEQAHIEKMKELLGGDTTRVHVKYKGDQPLQGPPIILLTNNYLSICNDSLFADRLVTYKWQAAPFLKQYNKKINPLFFFKLLLHWKIINDNIVIV
ncbi:SF3 helicase domain-containing protein, partial [Aphis craccivora]